jgi:hypothetical protein
VGSRRIDECGLKNVFSQGLRYYVLGKFESLTGSKLLSASHRPLDRESQEL